MANIDGTILGMTNLYKEKQGANGTREAWLVTMSFPLYDASSDVARLLAVGAAIDAQARDGLSSTLRGGMPIQAMDNGSGVGVYFTGETVQALVVSSDDLTGELNTAALVETDAAAGSEGCGIVVIVDRS